MNVPTITNSVGDVSIMERRPRLALFCSAKCPGRLILETYDLVKSFSQRNITVISGFHSPMEEECLKIILRSSQPVIWCLARGMYQRIPVKPLDYRKAVANGQLLVITPFAGKDSRISLRRAGIRNRVVAGLAEAVFIAHAAPGSKSETLGLEILAKGNRVFTFTHSANANLLDNGAKDIGDLDFETL